MTDNHLSPGRIRQAIERAKTLPDDNFADTVRAALRDAERQARRPIVLRSSMGHPHEWLVGPLGSERLVHCSLPALSVVWMALGYGRIRWADCLGPDVRYGVDVVRKSIKRQCVEWAQTEAACPPLIAAMLRIRFEGEWAVRGPVDDLPEFVTGLESPEVVLRSVVGAQRVYPGMLPTMLPGVTNP
jgi:hypothetical protein